MAIATVNPATAETERTYEALTPAEIDERIARAAAAFRGYRRVPPAERASALRRAADLLEREQDALARVMSREMGKLLQAGRDEAVKCARGCRYYADHAASLLRRRAGGERRRTAASSATSRSGGARGHAVELSVLAGVPLCGARPDGRQRRLLKHASNVTACALAHRGDPARAGFPAGVFQTLLIGCRAVAHVIDDPRIARRDADRQRRRRAAGRRQRAGQAAEEDGARARRQRPFIVLADARISPRRSRRAVSARMINSGQSCIAAKRFIVARAQCADEFERRVRGRMRAAERWAIR